MSSLAPGSLPESQVPPTSQKPLPTLVTVAASERLENAIDKTIPIAMITIAFLNLAMFLVVTSVFMSSPKSNTL